jgi:hypothetical protein
VFGDKLKDEKEPSDKSQGKLFRPREQLVQRQRGREGPV